MRFCPRTGRRRKRLADPPGLTRTAALLRGLAPLAVKVVGGTWAPLRKRHASRPSRRSRVARLLAPRPSRADIRGPARLREIDAHLHQCVFKSAIVSRRHISRNGSSRGVRRCYRSASRDPVSSPVIYSACSLYVALSYLRLNNHPRDHRSECFLG